MICSMGFGMVIIVLAFFCALSCDVALRSSIDIGTSIGRESYGDHIGYGFDDSEIFSEHGQDRVRERI